MTYTDRPFVFPVTSVEKITDGDTYWLHVDVGFRQTMLVHLRLLGWDTPELRRGSDHEKAQARRATEHAEYFILAGLHADDLWVRTERDPDNFGRWLGELWRPSTGARLGEHLELLDLAVPWPARWRDVHDT